MNDTLLQEGVEMKIEIKAGFLHISAYLQGEYMGTWAIHSTVRRKKMQGITRSILGDCFYRRNSPRKSLTLPKDSI